MALFSEVLREAREKSGLGVEALARILELSPQEIARYETDNDAPLPVLERYATIFGTPFHAFLKGGAVQSPATLLFRSAAEQGSDLGELLQSSDLNLLGDFLVVTAEVADLEGRLTTRPHPVKLTALRAPDVALPEWEQGRDLALAVRKELGLGSEPIDSMISLLETRYDAMLFFVETGQLDAAVQGASTLVPRPAILINLIGGRMAWWTTRVNLAHELCHLLFDFRGQARPYLVSPPGSGGDWKLVERFRSIERRANAFAVHLLAPGEGLRRLIGRMSPDSDRAIDAVCRHFGVGRTVAIRRLGQEFRISQSWQRLKLQGAGDNHDSGHPDAKVAVGLRTGAVRDLVRRGLEEGKLDSVEARGMLRTPMHVALDFDGFSDPPVISEEQAARTRAEAIAHSRGESNFWSTAARRTEMGWEVELRCMQDSEAKPIATKFVHLSAGLEPFEAI